MSSLAASKRISASSKAAFVDGVMIPALIAFRRFSTSRCVFHAIVTGDFAEA